MQIQEIKDGEKVGQLNIKEEIITSTMELWKWRFIISSVWLYHQENNELLRDFKVKVKHEDWGDNSVDVKERFKNFEDARAYVIHFLTTKFY